MAIIVQFNDGVAVNKFPINKSLFKIGRDPKSDIYIDDKLVSSEHALIEIIEGEKGIKEYYIKDLGSTNKTYVNEKVITRIRLKNEDLIRVGMNTFKFIDEEEVNPDKTVKLHKSWFPGVYYTEEKKD